ncbi:LPXTG cell wall anchor domain-containing protein [Bacillus cereus]|uniref:LPXTG cell wall anchor domain-containing protein n=1 Tax=Bacillus cereus TaxID=1396 RepID=UPI000531781B|nr:LPXTG cell wall anchor domain-containing protein [Bacillus cereus]KGT40609.1 cell wall anchor protein [Bacillus cereus]
MKKLLASATAVTLLTVGYSSSAFAAKSPNDTKNCGRLDNDKDGIPCEDYKYPKSTNTTTENKETTNPQEQPKQENNKQENSKQNNQTTNNKQEQTKPQTTVKETKKNTNTTVKKETKKQGEKLPNTASNGVTMMLASLGLALAGSVLMFRRKKTNA